MILPLQAVKAAEDAAAQAAQAAQQAEAGGNPVDVVLRPPWPPSAALR